MNDCLPVVKKWLTVCSLFQDNNVERAADWIFSHMGELESPMDTDQNAGEPQPRQAPTEPEFRNGSSSE